MLSSIAFTTLVRAVSTTGGGSVRAVLSSRGAPAIEAAFVARYDNNATHVVHCRRFMSGESLYAVDAPNGDHDLQDIVRLKFFMFFNSLSSFYVQISPTLIFLQYYYSYPHRRNLPIGFNVSSPSLRQLKMLRPSTNRITPCLGRYFGQLMAPTESMTWRMW